MSYHVTIQSSCLTYKRNRSKAAAIRQKLKYGPLPELIYWEEKDGEFEPIENYLNWDDAFVDELVMLSKTGVVGQVETTGEEHEHIKYVLKDEKVEEYNGETKVTYPSKPNAVYPSGGKS